MEEGDGFEFGIAINPLDWMVIVWALYGQYLW